MENENLTNLLTTSNVENAINKIKEGEYPVSLKSVEHKFSKTGNDMIKFTYQTVNMKLKLSEFFVISGIEKEYQIPNLATVKKILEYFGADLSNLSDIKKINELAFNKSFVANVRVFYKENAKYPTVKIIW